MSIKGSKIIVKFKSVGSGLMTTGILSRFDHTIIHLPRHPKGTGVSGFTIAGADGNFVFAKANIIGKDSVMVWNENVQKPVNIRFAWHRNPHHNLYNKEKLPASPFRTDNIKLSPLNVKKR